MFLFVLIVLIIVALILTMKSISSSQPSPFFDLPWGLWEVALIFIVTAWVENFTSDIFGTFTGTKSGELGELISFPVALASLCIFFFFSLGPQRTITVFGLNHRLGVLQILFGIRCTLLYISGAFILVVGILGIEGLSQGNLFQKVQQQWESWGWLGFFLQLTAGALAGSTLEEFMFRGLIYSTIRGKTHMWPAILITSTLFMLTHGINKYGIFFIGVFLCLLVEKSHSLLPAISAHVSHNFFVRTLTIPFVLYDSPSIYSYFLEVGFLGIVGIFLVEIWIRKRRNLPFGWDSIWSVPR